MKPLLKVMAILVAIFITVFILGRVFGIVTAQNIRWMLEQASQIDPVYVILTVIGLLFIDLLLSVPTLTIILLAGYFLGFPAAMAAALLGMTLSLLAGYGLSRKYGEHAVCFIIRDETQRAEMSDAFTRNGPAMIMLSRAAPMVPEVTACMAGVTRMPLCRYLVFYALGTVPYVAIAAYAGSVSSVDDPQPAIYAALGLYVVLWTGWFIYQRVERRKAAVNKSTLRP